ncbi:MAG: substrate-binding domain-containing protein [Anaerolineae bacterium]
MKRVLLTILAVIVLALGLSACGGTAATEEIIEEPEPTEAEATEPEEDMAEEEDMSDEEDMADEEDTSEDDMADDEAAGEPIRVGFITDQTGGLAIYGTMAERSFRLGMEYATGAPGEDDVWTLNGQEIQVFFRDDQSNPETTATLARELVEVEEVDILVGTVSSGATATLQEVARENQIPLIVAPAAANDITGASFNEYTFRVSRNNYQDAVALCQYLTQQYDSFIQIAPDYSFGYGGAEALRDACTEFGGEFVGEDVFAPADTQEFTPFLEPIVESDADAWLVTWAGGGFIAMMQAASDLGLTESKPLGSSFIDNGTMPVFFANNIGTTSVILYHYTQPDNEVNDWFTERMLEEYGTPPDLFDADGFNAALLLAEALQETGGDASADAMIEAMEGISFLGPKGEIFIRPGDHVAIQDMYIVTLENLDDPEFRYYSAVDTVRPEVPCLLPEELQDRCGDLPVGSLSGE